MAKIKPTVILIHGSWSGGWVWDDVVAEIRDAGFDTCAPTLTGLGDTADRLDEQTSHEVHVEDIVRFVKDNKLETIVLVGHSYGALVATVAAARLTNVVASLVVLDGFLVRRGKSLFDSYPEVEELMKTALSPDQPWKIMPFSGKKLGVPPGENLLAYDRSVTPMSWATHATPVTEDLSRINDLDRHYIRATAFPLFERTARLAGKEGWRVHEIESGHMVMMSEAAKLARLITEIARR